nr:polymeric immunoglobulin receptor-like isoform X1 [Paramormyrops kingsleyae]
MDRGYRQEGRSHSCKSHRGRWSRGLSNWRRWDLRRGRSRRGTAGEGEAEAASGVAAGGAGTAGVAAGAAGGASRTGRTRASGAGKTGGTGRSGAGKTAEKRSSTLKTFRYLRGQTGGSITIPCFYGQEHKNRVKSWCKSGNRPTCTSATKATQTKGTITDDPDNLVFLVTMKNLQQLDSGNYWCFVGEGRTKETSDSLLFLVTPNAQSVRTESWVSAPRGGSVTIPCYYDQNDKDKTKYLCRGYEWDSCSRIAQSDGEQSRGTVSVSDDRDQMVFNVTIRDLQEEDFDYYWCAVEASAAQSDRAVMPLIVREEIHVPSTPQTEWNHRTALRNAVPSPTPLTLKSSEKNLTRSHESRGQNRYIVDCLILSSFVIIAMLRTWYCCKSNGQEDMRAKQAKSALRRRGI